MATSPPLDEETAKQVLRQVEFYFSDSNVPRDSFMRNTINSSPDGMVSLGLICSFKKMRGYLKLGDARPEDVPEDTVKAVAETLRKSTSLNVSEDGKKVGRVAALLKLEEAIQQLDRRTIAASPLEYEAKQEDVASFFGGYAKVTSVRMPRHVADKRVFCGTALIEFSTEKEAEKVLEQSLFFAGVELELKPKKEFDAERAREVEDFENSGHSMGSNRKNNSNEEANYPKGLIVSFILKSISAEQVGAQEPVNDNTENTTLENESKDNGENVLENPGTNEENVGMGIEAEKEDKAVEETSSESKGKKADEGNEKSECPVEKDEEEGKLNPAACKDNMNVVLREDLKAVFQKFGVVKYIDFKAGEKSGYIRFEQPEAAQKARAAAVLAKEGGLTVKNFIATLEPVTGKAEREYWSLLRGNQEKHRGNKRDRGRGGKYHRGGGKHHRSRENDSARGRANKVQKVGAS
uniref:La protein 1 n=2 Tax=Rhizophora mucronata TaxID=61149 RepID=A0A2P2KLJ5_RHIMU